jgi:hypothetical protein
VTDKTSREILDGINAAIRETAALAAAGKLDVVAGMLGPVLRPLPESSTPERAKPKSAREILDGIAKAIEETRRDVAELDLAELDLAELDLAELDLAELDLADIDPNPRTSGGN